MRCFRAQPHAPHDWMSATRQVRCPGVTIVEAQVTNGDDSKLMEYMGTDARRWGTAFMIKVRNAGLPAGAVWTDEGIMHSWFANAIEAGRDAGSRSPATIDPEGLPAALIDGLSALADAYGGYDQIGRVALAMQELLDV